MFVQCTLIFAARVHVIAFSDAVDVYKFQE